MKTKWNYNPEGNVLVNFLKSKGFASKEEANEYLNFGEENLRKNYKDIDNVVKRILKSTKKNESICVYGDYDCDGICATSIIILALRHIGLNPNFFINNRFSEGYGMNVSGMQKLLEKFPETDLIITCDNGISAAEGIKLALDAGIDVVVTDHHIQKPNENIIVPTVDEWRNDEDESLREESCGAEIARRVMLNLYEKLGEDIEYIRDLITFSGIATVADVVKFTAANRCLVKICLQYLNEPVFPVISVIKEVMNLEEIDEETLGFQFGPLMNALSRVTGSPDEMVEILISKRNTLDVYEKVKRAVEVNNQRKQMSLENYETARTMIDDNDNCIIVAGDFDPGIAGLVCSQIVENYYRPCITLCNMGDGLLKGSARSYLDFHLKNALDKCADLLVNYGGHAGAAGLTITQDNLEEFRKRMNDLVNESGVLSEIPQIKIDYQCSISDMFDQNVQSLMKLAPFGEGFEKPKIVYEGKFKTLAFSPKDADVPKHVSFILKDKTGEVKTVWFNSYQKWIDLEPDAKGILKVLGSPRIEKFNAKYYRKLLVEDIHTD